MNLLDSSGPPNGKRPPVVKISSGVVVATPFLSAPHDGGTPMSLRLFNSTFFQFN